MSTSPGRADSAGGAPVGMPARLWEAAKHGAAGRFPSGCAPPLTPAPPPTRIGQIARRAAQTAAAAGSSAVDRHRDRRNRGGVTSVDLATPETATPVRTTPAQVPAAVPSRRTTSARIPAPVRRQFRLRPRSRTARLDIGGGSRCTPAGTVPSRHRPCHHLADPGMAQSAASTASTASTGKTALREDTTADHRDVPGRGRPRGRRRHVQRRCSRVRRGPRRARPRLRVRENYHTVVPDPPGQETDLVIHETDASRSWSTRTAASRSPRPTTPSA